MCNANPLTAAGRILAVYEMTGTTRASSVRAIFEQASALFAQMLTAFWHGHPTRLSIHHELISCAHHKHKDKKYKVN